MRDAARQSKSIVQIGTPRDLYLEPRDDFVAGLVGDPPISPRTRKAKSFGAAFLQIEAAIGAHGVLLVGSAVADGSIGPPNDSGDGRVGVIVGKNVSPIKHSTYLLTKDKFTDFRLIFSGKLVTSAALILMFAFLVLSSSPGYEIKVFAIGLAAGIAYAAVYGHAHETPARLAEFTCAVPEQLPTIDTRHAAHPAG